ncbi:MAG: sulfur oxidation c-type cytochrome SoxA [Burkholderiaceae bacterium]
MKPSHPRALLTLGLLLVVGACGVTQSPGPATALPAASGAARLPATLADPRRSGYLDMSPALQAMQHDATQHPGLLWVADGAALWSHAPASGPACAGCHGAGAADTLRDVAARYPAWDAGLARPVDLGQRINLCRERHQRAAPWTFESQELLALESYVAHAARGLPVTPPDDPRLLPYRVRGEALHRQRLGQLDLSCAQCHDERAGGRLGGSVIPQGRSVGYPTYRLEWQGLGSLQRRLRNCMTGVRAEPFAYGSTQMIELELYLAWRDRGMGMETPSVRP